MVGEIILEVVVLVVLLIVAIAFGRNGVRLVNRKFVNFSEEGYTNKPPRRNRNCTKWSRELNESFMERNSSDMIDSKTVIRLPSKTAVGIVAAIESAVFVLLVAFSHFDGIAEFLIIEKVYDDWELFRGRVEAFLFAICVFLALGLVLSIVIENVVKARAQSLGEDRLANGCRVHFVQALSVSEIWARFKWFMGEEAAARRNKRAEKKCRKATVHGKYDTVNLPIVVDD